MMATTPTAMISMSILTDVGMAKDGTTSDILRRHRNGHALITDLDMVVGERRLVLRVEADLVEFPACQLVDLDLHLVACFTSGDLPCLLRPCHRPSAQHQAFQDDRTLMRARHESAIELAVEIASADRLPAFAQELGLDLRLRLAPNRDADPLQIKAVGKLALGDMEPLVLLLVGRIF